MLNALFNAMLSATFNIIAEGKNKKFRRSSRAICDLKIEMKYFAENLTKKYFNI